MLKLTNQNLSALKLNSLFCDHSLAFPKWRWTHYCVFNLWKCTFNIWKCSHTLFSRLTKEKLLRMLPKILSVQHENPSFSTCLHTWFIYYHNFNLAFISFAWKGFHKCSPKGIECRQRMHKLTMVWQKNLRNFCLIQNIIIMRILKKYRKVLQIFVFLL